MKTLLLTLIFALTPAADARPYDHTHAALDATLKARVTDGLVDYAGLKGDRAALDAYLAEAGAVTLAEFQQWNQNDQLAFLMNVYNAATLQLIIDNYPVDSIKSLGSLVKSPWSKEFVVLYGKTISLDTLEHKIIRKNYREPRIHFALVCAAMGCPPLRAEAFQGARLDAQLSDQVKAFLSTPEKNRVDVAGRTLYLSPIFKWYREDFETGGKGLADFVAPWYPETGAGLDSYKIEFTDYDWALNDQGAKG